MFWLFIIMGLAAWTVGESPGMGVLFLALAVVIAVFTSDGNNQKNRRKQILTPAAANNLRQVKGNFGGARKSSYSPENKSEERGKEGERIVTESLSRLTEEQGYKKFHGVFVPEKGHSVYTPGKKVRVTEIDHLIISRFGIFVLETKSISGYLYGDKDDWMWIQFPAWEENGKQEIGKGRPIGNPLQQNRTHIKFLKEYLNMPENKFHSVVCFTDETVKFMKQMPPYVVTRYYDKERGLVNKWVDYISWFDHPLLSADEAREAENKIAALVENRRSLEVLHREQKGYY